MDSNVFYVMKSLEVEDLGAEVNINFFTDGLAMCHLVFLPHAQYKLIICYPMLIFVTAYAVYTYNLLLFHAKFVISTKIS